MGQILSHWRVPAAVLSALALVGGAYFLARGASPFAEASTETELLRAIATRDLNNDGLPDWQGVLYGIPADSTTTDYFGLGMTNGEAVARGLIVPKAIADLTIATSSGTGAVVDPSLPPSPAEGTLTDTFAKNFFLLYLEAQEEADGRTLSSEQMNTFIERAFSTVSPLFTAAPNYKSADDLIVSGSGEEALKTFAAAAEAILLKNRSAVATAGNELLYLQSAIERNDATSLFLLVSTAKMYRNSAAGLAALPVPEELASGVLTLINGMTRASGIANDFARVNLDPLAAMFALEQYVQLDRLLFETFAGIDRVYAAAGVSLPAGESGALFLGAVARYRATAGGDEAI